MRPVPAPPKKTCARYFRNGTKCTEKTVRHDGWCGTCDGYTDPEPAAPVRMKPRKPVDPAHQQWGFPGVEIDDIPYIDITRAAIVQFMASHGGSESEARIQIRSFLEDLILMPLRRGIYNTDTKVWVVGTQRFDYSLVLGRDFTVIAYRTKHAERSWAQYKSGVKSRLGHGRSGGGPAWLRNAVSDLPPVHGVRLLVVPCKLYLRNMGIRKVMQENVSACLPIVSEAFTRAMDSWDGKGIYVPDPEREGAFWVVAENREIVVTYLVDRAEDGAPEQAQG